MTVSLQLPSSYKIYAYLSSTWTDITADAITDNISAKWGMMGHGENDRLSGTGLSSFTLNNTEDKYIPSVVGALTDWTIGAPVKVVVTYDSVDYIRFRGFVSKLDPIAEAHANEARVKVTVLDWMDYATRFPLVSPSIQLDKTADVALTTIISGMPIAPQNTDFDTGTQTFQALFDTVTTGTKAYTEFQKLALSELGYIYLKKDSTYGETLRFESAAYRNGSRTVKKIITPTINSGFLLNEDGSYLLNEDGSKFILDEVEDVTISDTMMDMSIVYGKNIINRATARAHPKKTDTSAVVLYSLDTPMAIGAGETLIFKGKYSDPSGGLPVNAISSQMIDPERTTGLDAYTKSLLHFDGENGSKLFLDDSEKVWTVFGDAKIDRDEKVFGTASGFFNGSDSYITTPSSDDFEFGSGDFTVDWWEYRTSATGNKSTIARDAGSSFPAFILGDTNGTDLQVYMTSNGSSWDIALFKYLGSLDLNTWVHLAVVRNGTDFYAFKNGIIQSTWTSALSLKSNVNPFSVGRINGLYYFQGYIDELRVSKGIARWTSNFDPPVMEYNFSDYKMWTNSDETGTDISNYLTVSVIYGTEAPIYTLTNTSGSAGYITKLQARGFGIYAYNPIEATVEDNTSILAYGEKPETIDQLYQRDLTSGSAWASSIIAAEKDPRLVLESVSLNANSSGILMQAFLNCDIGDMVNIVETRTGIDGNYYIQNISYEIQPGGIINYTWGLKEQL